jgi:DNA recombination protein RmuC
MTALLILVLVLNVVVLAVLALLFQRQAHVPDPEAAVAKIGSDMLSLERGLSQSFASATAEIAKRLEQTKGDLRQEVADRLTTGFKEIHGSVEQHLVEGRREQTSALAQARTELTTSLASTTAQLKSDFEGLNQRTEQKLEAIRGQVDQKLLEISGQVQEKLNENLKEGFAQFEKVQQHLKAAEEQLRQVGTIGNSINDLNNLLKLPHLRGKFGEASLERLLADFLPSHMYELQASPGEDRSRADALIHFPDRKLPIDAKFPREQVLALFESSDEEQIAEAREQLGRVLKIEAKRIAAYIQPDHGTMDVALMYLPSETLYIEAIRNAEAAEALARLRVFPVSPNTLLMTIRTIALAHRWYEVAARFEETRKEIARANKSLEYFQTQFEFLGKSLEKAQEAFGKASTHLKHYRGRVAALTGEEGTQLELPENGAPLAKAEGSGG